MDFFNDYIMFRLIFDDKKRAMPPNRRRPTAAGPSTTASNYASRRESMVDLRRMSGAPSVTSWRQSVGDVSQQMRQPMRQRLMRKRSGSWSGPPSGGSSSHHLLAIEEEDHHRPISPCAPLNKHLANLANCERKWASLDIGPPTIQVTQADKDAIPSGSQQQADEDQGVEEPPPLAPPASPRSPRTAEPYFTTMTSAGMAAMLRIKEKLARKRSGSLPENRLGISEADRSRLTPHGHVSADATVSTSPTSGTSPISLSPSSPNPHPQPGLISKFAVRRSTGSLPSTSGGGGVLSPRLLLATQSPSSLTLSPIASPAPSAPPTPTHDDDEGGRPLAFAELRGGSSPRVAKGGCSHTPKLNKALTQRRKTVADISEGIKKDLGDDGGAESPSSASSLLELYLPGKKARKIDAADSIEDEEDNVILDLGYKYEERKSCRTLHRRATCATVTVHHHEVAEQVSVSTVSVVATANLIHFSSSDEEVQEQLPLAQRVETVVEQVEVVQQVPIPTIITTRKDSTQRRPLAPCLAAISSKFRRHHLGGGHVGRRGGGMPRRGDTLPDRMPAAALNESKSLLHEEADEAEETANLLNNDEADDESWLRKSSAPLPPKRGFRRLLQHQRPCASQEVSKMDMEQGAVVRRRSQSRQGELLGAAAMTGEWVDDDDEGEQEEEEKDEVDLVDEATSKRKKSTVQAPPQYLQPHHQQQQPQVQLLHRAKPPLVDRQPTSIQASATASKPAPVSAPPQAPPGYTQPPPKPIRLHESDRKWSDSPRKLTIPPEMPDRSKSESQKRSKWTAQQRRSTQANPFEQTSTRAMEFKEQLQLPCEISISLHYTQSIGFLTVMINSTKNTPKLKDAFLRILRFESDRLIDSTRTPVLTGKTEGQFEFKQAYMFGMEESKLLITHLIIELWESSAQADQRRFGHVVIGPQAGGSGCFQWTRVCKHPNFPSSVWHQFARTEN